MFAARAIFLKEKGRRGAKLWPRSRRMRNEERQFQVPGSRFQVPGFEATATAGSRKDAKHDLLLKKKSPCLPLRLCVSRRFSLLDCT
jgi:hypothetical protein